LLHCKKTKQNFAPDKKEVYKKKKKRKKEKEESS